MFEPRRSIHYLGRRRCSCSAAGAGAGVGEAVLVHDPIRLGAPRGAPLVEDERLLEPDHPLGVGAAPDGPVRPRGLPEPALRRPVRPPAAAGLPVPRHEEVPLPLPDLRHRCAENNATADQITNQSHRPSHASPLDDPGHTRKVPGVVAVDVERADDVEVELLAVDHAVEVEVEELLLRGVEPEAREVLLHFHGHCHWLGVLPLKCSFSDCSACFASHWPSMDDG